MGNLLSLWGKGLPMTIVGGLHGGLRGGLGAVSGGSGANQRGRKREGRVSGTGLAAAIYEQKAKQRGYYRVSRRTIGLGFRG